MMKMEKFMKNIQIARRIGMYKYLYKGYCILEKTCYGMDSIFYVYKDFNLDSEDLFKSVDIKECFDWVDNHEEII